MTTRLQAIEQVFKAHTGHRIAVSAPGHLGDTGLLQNLFGTMQPLASGKDLTGTFYSDSAGYLVTDLSRLHMAELNYSLMSGGFDLVLVLVDGHFGPGQKEHWVRFMAGLSGIAHVVVAVDKDDAGGGGHEDFENLKEVFAQGGEIGDPQVQVVPVCVASGGNLQTRNAFADWYDGPALAEVMATCMSASSATVAEPDGRERSDQFSVYVCWLADEAVIPGRTYRLEHRGQCANVQVSSLKYRFNPQTLDHQAATRLHRGQVGYGNIALDDEISFARLEDGAGQSAFTMHDAETGALAAFGFIRHGLRRATNIKWHQLQVDKKGRAAAKGQRPCVLWFTGLSGSGKSSVATLIDKKLHAAGKHTFVLDGDNVRHGLCRDLGFTEAERVENIRRIAEVSKLLVESGLIVMVSFISPFHRERQSARELFEDGEFVEVFVDTPLEVCEARDPKGLYKKARAGEIINFTGLDSPYERPENAEIVLPGGEMSAEEMADKVIAELDRRGLVSKGRGQS